MAKKKTQKIDVALSANAKEFKKQLDKAEKDVGKFSKASSKAFKSLKMAGVGLAAGMGAAFVKAGLDFEAMEGILIKGTGATGTALEDLKTQATDVLKTVPETAEVVAGAIADVNTFFAATGDQLEATTGLFLDFARVADMDVGDAIARVDAQMTQFNIPLEETDELLGDLVRVAQATGAPMDNLLGQLEKFGPLFATAAFTGEETIAMFGMLEQAGVDVTKLGPALTKFFADVAEAGGEPRQAFEDLVAQIANAETETQALALASEAFGTAGARMTSAIRSGNLELETFGGLLGVGTGLVDAQADATETLSDKFAIMKNSLMAAMGPIALELMDKFTVAMEGVAPFIERNQELLTTLGVAIGAVTAAFVAFKIATVAWTVVSTAATVATTAWAVATTALNVAIGILTAPITLFVATIAAMVAGVVLAYQHFDLFRAAVDGLADGVVFAVEAFVGLPKLLWDTITGGARWILAAGKSIGLNLLKGIGDALGGAVEWATSFAKDIANALIRFVNIAIDDLNNFLEIDIDMPGFLPDININPPDIPGIPLLAAGGIVTAPTLAVIGEAGPEAVIPLNRAGGGMGGGPMTVNVYMPVGSDGDSVVRALQEYEARNGPVPVGTRSL
jgi:TP901 family phage tail tape measure protein